MSLASYTFPLTAVSGIWIYAPGRDTVASTGWNNSFTGGATSPPGGTGVGLGNVFQRTQLSGASVSADFVGTGILLCFTDNGASFNVQLDGNAPTSDVPNDPVCRAQGASKTINFANLEPKEHSLQLSVTNASSAQEFQFYGAVMSTDIALLSNDDKIEEKVIDDLDPAWVMQRQGGVAWDNMTDTRFTGGSASFTCIYGETRASETSYSFTNASAVILNGVPDTGSFGYTVVLEGNDVKLESDLHAGWRIPGTPVFFQSGLDPEKTYNLRFQNWNANQECEATACCQEIDTLVLIGSSMRFNGIIPTTTSSLPAPTQSSPTESALPAATNSSSNIAPIVGGIVGGFLGSLLIFFLAFFLIRRRRRRKAFLYQQHSPSPYTYLNGRASSIGQMASVQALPPGSVTGVSYYASSDASQRYFPSMSHPRTSMFSSSTGTPYVEHSTGAYGQPELDGRSSSLAGPSMPSKPDSSTGRVVRTEGGGDTMPPPYRG